MEEEGHNSTSDNPAVDNGVDEQDEDTLGSAIDHFQNKKEKKIGRRNTAPAKTEGHETIRTHLQKKRASINQNIGHEVELKKGAKRLIRVSSDLKSRETAMLEAHYSDSKIQLLQQELATVNNSLQAYQDESVRDSQIPLIPLLVKTTSKVNFIKPFTDFISQHYYEDAGKYQEALYEFSEMRLTMCNPVKDQSGIDSMYEYYNQLYLVGKRFFGPSSSSHVVFVWYDAVNGIPAAQKSVAFEKCSVLFNIGAMHTQCAARQTCSTVEDVDSIITRLRKAAGMFEYIRDNFHKSPTLDMKKESLDLFVVMMKAQADMLLWQKEVKLGLKEDVTSLAHYALLTNTVSLSYQGIRKTVETKEYVDYIPEAWVGLIKVHGAYMEAIAHYYAALVHMTIVRGLNKSNGDDSGDTSLPSTSKLKDLIRKMYADNTANIDEILTIKVPHQVSVARSQLDVANLLHGDSIRYEKQNKSLQSMGFLHKLFSHHHERSLELMAEAAKQEKGPSVMAPSTREIELDFQTIPPEFPSADSVKDLFHDLGPLPTFSGANNWEKPCCVKIKRSEVGFGFSVRSSKPVRISGVDQGSEAEIAGLKRDDYVIAVNGKEALYMTHAEVVAAVKASEDYVTITLSTPTGVGI